MRIASEKGELALTLTGVCAWLTLTLFRGFSPEWAALPLATAAVASMIGTRLFIPGFLILLVSGASSSGAAASAVAGLYAVFVSTRLRGRISGFLAVSLWVAANPSPSSLPLLAGLVLPVPFRVPEIRVILAVLAVTAILTVSGPFQPSSDDPPVSRFHLREQRGWWTVPQLTLGRPETVLLPPVPAPFRISLDLSCGGVRDSLPMALIRAGDSLVTLSRGDHSLAFLLEGSDSVFISLIRTHRPFTHPVVHARAEAEW